MRTRNNTYPWRVFTVALCAFGAALVHAQAQPGWQQQEFFLNSESLHAYFYSAGNVSAPSTLELIDKKLPVDTSSFVSAPNSLRLAYKSAPNGAWDVEVRLPNWPGRYIDFNGDTLYFWMYSAVGISAKDLPLLCLRDSTNGFSGRLRLGNFAHALLPGKWTRVAIPVKAIPSASMHAFQPARMNALVFLQGAPDNASHVLLIDDIRMENAALQHDAAPGPPMQLEAKGYERHVQLTWKAATHGNVTEYVIYRSLNGGPFTAVATQRPDLHRAMDFLGDAHARAAYKVTARTSAMRESPMSNEASATTHPMTDEELLTMVQEASFQYYWDGAEPNSGMGRESIPGDPDEIALGGSGFGIMALVVGADRGFAPRDAVVDRMLRITGYLARADRFHGAWPHFLSGRTGHILPNFGLYDDGADLVETSFLMEGLLTARGYFTHDTPRERQLREEITALWRGVEWDWFNATPKHDALYWHWSPDFGFHTANRIAGWNETMITYLLGIASPTHPIPASLYYTGWAGEGTPGRKYGTPSEGFGVHLEVADPNGFTGPLFFTHYSFMGYDPRGVRDKFTDYFVNNRNMSVLQLNYSVANPHHYVGYGADAWGLSAVTGPHGYRAYHPPNQDDGTLAPTAAMGAYAYTPEASLAALKHFYRDLGQGTWDVYGFRNAFNETEDWYATGELALNQAPQAVMIENGRTGLLWKSFMSNPEMPLMQKAIGFTADGKK